MRSAAESALAAERAAAKETLAEATATARAAAEEQLQAALGQVGDREALVAGNSELRKGTKCSGVTCACNACRRNLSNEWHANYEMQSPCACSLGVCS